jgi:hypothetical protein
MQQGLAVEETLVELVDFSVTPTHSLFKHYFSSLIAVNDQVVLRLPHVTLFATDDREPKKRLVFGIGIDAWSITAFFPSSRHLRPLSQANVAIAHPGFQIFQLGDALVLGKSEKLIIIFPRADVFFRITGRSAFSDPAKKLGRIEETVPVENERSRNAVFKLQIASVGALAGSGLAQVMVLARTVRTIPPPNTRTMST